jgi:hypothetical protein
MLANDIQKTSLGDRTHTISQRTHDFRKQLAKDADKLIVDELAAFERRVFESLDLLLHNDLKGSGPDEEGWS